MRFALQNPQWFLQLVEEDQEEETTVAAVVPDLLCLIPLLL
jgi:hypothetical protein